MLTASAHKRATQQRAASNIRPPPNINGHNINLRQVSNGGAANADAQMADGGGGGGDGWLHAFLVEQDKVMQPHLTEGQIVVAREILGAIQTVKCSLCGQYGHHSAHCWFNGTFYDECRRKGRLDVNYAFRGGIKSAKKL